MRQGVPGWLLLPYEQQCGGQREPSALSELQLVQSDCTRNEETGEWRAWPTSGGPPVWSTGHLHFGQMRTQLLPSYSLAHFTHCVPAVPRGTSQALPAHTGASFTIWEKRVETSMGTVLSGEILSPKPASPSFASEGHQSVANWFLISLCESSVVVLGCGICCLWYDFHVRLSRGNHRKDGTRRPRVEPELGEARQAGHPRALGGTALCGGNIPACGACRDGSNPHPHQLAQSLESQFSHLLYGNSKI